MKNYTSVIDPGRALALSLRRSADADGWVLSSSSPRFRGAAELVGRGSGRQTLGGHHRGFFREYLWGGCVVVCGVGGEWGETVYTPCWREVAWIEQGAWANEILFPGNERRVVGPAWWRLLPGNLKTRSWVGLRLCWELSLSSSSCLKLSQAGSPWNHRN